MICPYCVTYSIAVGAILSYGLLWPLINMKAGTWYPIEDGQGSNAIQGLAGYKVRDSRRPAVHWDLASTFKASRAVPTQAEMRVQ